MCGIETFLCLADRRLGSGRPEIRTPGRKAEKALILGSCTKMANELHLTLVENAEDFLLEAVRHCKASTSRDWKYATLHLWSALELLLKAILEKEHWTFLFEEVDEASREKLQAGNFQSVRPDTALKRLQSIVDVEIEPKDFKYLTKLRDLRNRLMHFSVRLNVEQAKSLVARGINTFLSLQQQYLHDTPDRTLEYEVNLALQEFQKYVDARLRSLQQELRTSERPHDWFTACPICAQETLVAEDEKAVCLFCGEECLFEDLAAERSETPSGLCPECEGRTLALLLLNNDEGRLVCVRCGFEAERDRNTTCSGCGSEFWSEDGSSMCDNCWSFVLDKD
jgi:hypothetical protein